MLRNAKEQGYRIVLHYMLIGSASQAVDRIALRVIHGGHHVPEDDVCRRFDRSRKHVIEDYLPLAEDWVLWDNSEPPHLRLADSSTHDIEQLKAMIASSNLKEGPHLPVPEMVRIGLEASEAATAKMLDYYKRLGIRVTPQMTLAPEPKKRAR
jgi:hypothetical protein